MKTMSQGRREGTIRALPRLLRGYSENYLIYVVYHDEGDCHTTSKKGQRNTIRIGVSLGRYDWVRETGSEGREDTL